MRRQPGIMNINKMKRISIKNICLSLLGSTLLWTCADRDSYPDIKDMADGQITVVLRIPLSESPTRANPEGGEDGNGREQGKLNENAVHDVNVFFFKGSGLNPQHPESIEVAGVYVPSMSEDAVSEESLPFEKKVTVRISTSATSLVKSGLLSASTDVSFITVLNAGVDLGESVANLKELREFTGFEKAWTCKEGSNSAEDCDRFVMTTAYDADANGNVNINGSGRNVGSGRLVKVASGGSQMADVPVYPEGQEWYGETTVQRICARIDLMHDGNLKKKEGGEAELVYKVQGADTTLNTVHITNILPVNVMSEPSYLLRKVTAGLPAAWNSEVDLGSIIWGGIEKTAEGAKPDNYVIEPKTLTKEGDCKDRLQSWYGDTRTSKVKENIKDISFGKTSSYYSYSLEGTKELERYSGITVVGYANENIQSPRGFISDYLTGISFRAIYQPRVLSYFKDGSVSHRIISDKDWSEMDDKGFTRYQPTVKYSHTESGSGMNTVSVTDDMALYFADHEDALAYAAANSNDLAVITRFDNGICYYNLWLRHYNDVADVNYSDPHAPFGMEFATVRNNIYRVALSFAGPGDPEPTMREPYTMMARIFVRKWNMRTENSPLQF